MSLATDVHDLVTLVRKVRHQLVRANDVGARRVDRLQAELDGALLDLGRNAVRCEVARSFRVVLGPGEPVGLVDERDALLLKVVGGVRVVDQHAKHVNWAFGLLAHALGDTEGIHHAVAVPARRDLDDFHVAPSLREMISPTMAVAAAGSIISERAAFARDARVARSAALVLDTIVFGFITLIVNSVYGVTEITSSSISASGTFMTTTTAVAWPWLTLLGMLYFAIPEAMFGASPGKYLLRLRVVRLDGRPLGLDEVIVRNLLKPIDFLPIRTCSADCWCSARQGRRG